MKLLAVALLTGLALAACQSDNAGQHILAPVPELRHGLMQGYLHEEPPLNSAAFLPPPPASGSAQQAADDAASAAMRVFEGSARGHKPLLMRNFAPAARKYSAAH